MGKKRRPNTGKKQGGARYQPAREPKLRAPAAQPPPLPALARADDPQVFGRAPEDGLRVLAALETISSLEPDFAEDLTGEEAAVTIIELPPSATGHETAEEAAPHASRYTSLRARLGSVGTPLDVDADDYAAFMGPMEEATVEIIGGRRPLEPDAAPAEEPPPRRLPVARRVLKALRRGG